MTLADLIKHMAAVEECWTAAAQGRAADLPWDWTKAVEDWDWRTSATPTCFAKRSTA